MRIKKLVCLLGLAIFLVGCSSAPAEPAEPPVDVISTAIVVEPTDPVEPTQEELPTSSQNSSASTDQIERVAENTLPEIDACVACHSDKQRLIDTAKPDETAASENSGEG